MTSGRANSTAVHFIALHRMQRSMGAGAHDMLVLGDILEVRLKGLRSIQRSEPPSSAITTPAGSASHSTPSFQWACRGASSSGLYRFLQQLRFAMSCCHVWCRIFFGVLMPSLVYSEVAARRGR
jgi:hypothetical protein